jgi:hypothetical protein
MMHQAFLLQLIPATLDGAPYTLHALQQRLTLMPIPNGGEGNMEGFRQWYQEDAADDPEAVDVDIKRIITNTSPEASYWLLSSRKLMPYFQGRSFGEMREQLENIDFGSTTSHLVGNVIYCYRPPYLIEAVTVAFCHFLAAGERILPEEEDCFSVCMDLDDQNDCEGPVAMCGHLTATGGMAIAVTEVEYELQDENGTLAVLE